MEFLENLDFGGNLRKISILVEILENLNVSQNFQKISILLDFLEIFENIDFGRIFDNSISVEIFEDLDFGRSFGKSRFWSKFSKNLLAEIF